MMKISQQSLKMYMLIIPLMILLERLTSVGSIFDQNKNSADDGSDELSVRKIDSSIFADPNGLLFPDEELYEEIVSETDSGFSTKMDYANNKGFLVLSERRFGNVVLSMVSL